jgi:hypothetical protein
MGGSCIPSLSRSRFTTLNCWIERVPELSNYQILTWPAGIPRAPRHPELRLRRLIPPWRKWLSMATPRSEITVAIVRATVATGHHPACA